MTTGSPSHDASGAGASGNRPALDAVLFDFGGVFTESPFAAFVNFANEVGVEPMTMLTAVFGDYGADTDHPWHRLERGEIPFTDALAEIRTLLDERAIEVDPFAALMGLASSGTRDYMLDAAYSISAAGIPIIIVTNNIAEFGEHWKKMVPIERFDHVVDSSEIGIRKPDPEIYRYAMGLVGASPERTAFVDDAPGNVDAAVALGIRSILVPHEDEGARAVAAQLVGWASGGVDAPGDDVALG